MFLVNLTVDGSGSLLMAGFLDSFIDNSRGDCLVHSRIMVTGFGPEKK